MGKIRPIAQRRIARQTGVNKRRKGGARAGLATRPACPHPGGPIRTGRLQRPRCQRFARDGVDTVDPRRLGRRLLAIQALESARCIEEKVVTDMREADVGSILGFGFAPFTGGTISYIDGMGTRAFVDLCNELTATCGERFKPGALLLDMAKTGDTFYRRFPPPQRKAAA